MQHTLANTIRLALVCLASMPCIVGVQHAAAQLPPALNVDEGLRQDNARPEAYIHDSFEAEELIIKANRQADAGAWSEASRNLLRTLDRHADRVSRVKPGLYVSISERINQIVTRWPAEGSAAYRRMVEPQARRALDAALDTRNIESLKRVADLYYCTSFGAKAVETIAQLAIEEGDFSLADDAYLRLLERYPKKGARHSAIMASRAVAHALWGKAEQAYQIAEQAGEGSMTQWMGRPEPLSHLVATLLENISPSKPDAEEFGWNTVGGNYRRNRVTDLSIDRLAMLWRLDGVGESTLVSLEDRSSNFNRAQSQGRFLSMNPVAAGGVLFLHDGGRVIALRRDTGKVLWRFSGLKEPASGTFSSDAEVSRWFGATVAEGRLYACLGSNFVPYYGYEAPENTSALICLDAETGRQIWWTDRVKLGVTGDELSFEATPIAANGRVYAVVRRKRAFGFEDCFLYCFDSQNGQTLFSTHLSSASTGGFGYRRPTLSIPSLMGDTVYVATNLGSVAAIDRHTGTVRWLRLYERISEAAWRREGRGHSRDLNPWQYNPLICANGRVHALPTDSNNLFIFDARTGKIEQEVPIDELSNLQSLLGVEGTRIYGVGDEVIVYDLADHSDVWRNNLPEGDELFGRATLTETQVLIPTAAALCAYDRLDGRVSFQPWEAPGQGGNLLAMPGQLLVAGNESITAYARKSDVLARLRRRMDDAPRDPVPALDLAEVLLRAGDIAAALEVLDDAVVRAGGFAGSITLELKQRLFGDCMNFAHMLLDREPLQLEAINHLFQKASQCAWNTRTHLSYRLEWAGVHEMQQHWEEAVDLYQQIIADRSLAAQEYAADGHRTVQAQELAENRIAELIERHGRKIYARFDQQAAELLESARKSQDSEMLSRLVETFPNSFAAPDALVVRADAQEQGGQYFAAAGELRDALVRYPRMVEQAKLMVRIADCYVKADRSAEAWRWLTKAAREHPSATTRLNGQQVRLLDYRDQLGDLASHLEPKPPSVAPPLSQAYKREFEAEMHLLEPRFPSALHSDWIACLVYVRGRLHWFNARTNESVWESTVEIPEKPELLVQNQEALILATRHRILAISPKDGSLLFAYGERPAEADNPDLDPEVFDAFASFALHQDRLLVTRTDGVMACLALKDGRQLWRLAMEDTPSGPVSMNGMWVVYPAETEGGPSCLVRSTTDGGLVRTIRMADDRQVIRTFLTLEGTVILLTVRTIHCYEPSTGRQLWRVEPERNLVEGSVVLDVDGLYLCDDLLEIEKLNLANGRTLWRAENPEDVSWRESEGLSVHLFRQQVLVTTERRVFSLSARDGRLMWQGTVDRDVRFRFRFISEKFLVAVNVPRSELKMPMQAFFYDLQGASGKISSPGGVAELDSPARLRGIAIRDGALLVQDDATIHAWSGKGDP